MGAHAKPALVDPLILVLFLLSGAATGWLGVDLLPEPLLVQVTNPEGLRLVLAGFGAVASTALD